MAFQLTALTEGDVLAALPPHLRAVADTLIQSGSGGSVSLADFALEAGRIRLAVVRVTVTVTTDPRPAAETKPVTAKGERTTKESAKGPSTGKRLVKLKAGGFGVGMRCTYRKRCGRPVYWRVVTPYRSRSGNPKERNQSCCDDCAATIKAAFPGTVEADR